MQMASALLPRMFPLLSCAAPCQLHADFLAAQLSVLTWALAENPSSCAAVVQPAFSYNKGKLILEEKKVLTLLQQGHHNLDYTFQLQFRQAG